MTGQALRAIPNPRVRKPAARARSAGRKPVEAAAAMEIAKTRLPTAAWKTHHPPPVFHSSHRLGGEQ
jgi:hypothetical protein